MGRPPLARGGASQKDVDKIRDPILKRLSMPARFRQAFGAASRPDLRKNRELQQSPRFGEGRTGCGHLHFATRPLSPPPTVSVIIPAEKGSSMGRNRRIGGRLDVLDRIVADLLILAVCAEWIAASPRPLRWLVVWALRPADAVVRRFLAGPTCNAARVRRSPVALVLRKDAAPAEARDLASSLRMQALTLRAMTGQLRRQTFLLPRWTVARRNSRRPRPAIPERSESPARRIDTS